LRRWRDTGLKDWQLGAAGIALLALGFLVSPMAALIAGAPINFWLWFAPSKATRKKGEG